MVEFAGYSLPVEYSGVKDEHLNVRERVGIFDVSHMGEFRVLGPEAFNLLQRITTNDVARLHPGKVQYSCLPNGKGGIVDDLLVYCFDREDYLLVVNASNMEKDWNWINGQNREGAVLDNQSSLVSQVAVQGPAATEVLKGLTQADLSNMEYYTFITSEFAGIPDVIISSTGYTGSGGFELYFKNDAAAGIWKAILDEGGPYGIKPAGLAARDTLRLEMGFCLYGNDIDETTSPIEAGLGWITKFTEGKDFIDRERLLKQKKEGTDQRLTGFAMLEKGIPRHGYSLHDREGRVVGRVTSGTMSPVLDRGIGLGYLETPLSGQGTKIFVGVRNKMLRAETVKLPFIN